MQKRKILIILLSIIIILILGVVFILIMNKKDTSEKLIINDINNVSTTKNIDVTILDLYKDSIGYNIKISIKNNSKQDISIESIILKLKDKKGNDITRLYTSIDNTIKPNEEYSTELITDEDLSNTKIIDYELVD